MKLTNSQIEKIEIFVRSKYIEYYDIQLELVDHLASAIESELKQFPNQDFDKVLLAKYKNFGIFGFSEFVDERAKAIYSASIKRHWKHFLDFFKMPKLIYSLLIFLFNFLIILNLRINQYMSFFLLYFVIICLVEIVVTLKLQNQIKLKLIQKNYQPFWISTFGLTINFFNLVLGENLKTEIFRNPYFISSICTLGLICVWAELSIHVLIHQKLRFQYPEAFKN